MASDTVLTSPYASDACAYRLQQLAAHTTYRVAQRRGTTDLGRLRLDLVRDADEDYAFALRLRGRGGSRVRLLGGVVYLVVGGRLVATDAGTEVVLRVRPGLPVAVGDWLLQLLWYGVLLGTQAALILWAWFTAEGWAWQVAGGFAVFVALLYLVLAAVYGRAVRATRALLARAVAAPPPGDRARITVLR